MSLENTSQSATIEVGGIEMPHGKLAQEAYETTRALLPDVLNNHAQRVYVFAALAAKRRAIQLDGELLYVAARFSNVGLAAAYADSKRRYEVDSADAILAFLGRNHVADAIAQEAWHAVALHTSFGIADEASLLAASLAAGIRADLFGDDGAALSRESEQEIFDTFPRGEKFKERFIDAIGQGIAHRPSSTFGSVNGDILERLDPDFCRINYCGLILGAKWDD